MSQQWLGAGREHPGKENHFASFTAIWSLQVEDLRDPSFFESGEFYVSKKK